VLPRLAAVSSPGVTVLPLEPADALSPRRLALAWHRESGNARELEEFVSAVARQAARIAAAMAATSESAARRRA
jgi:hypothetical protein